MRSLPFVPILLIVLSGCSSQYPQARSAQPPTRRTVTNPFPVAHVFVALCDNEHQGIIPVSASLGNGDDPATNLYWGAGFGVRTFLSKSNDWKLVSSIQNPKPAVLERCIFKHRRRDVFLIADAYRGREIAQAIWDFYDAAAGKPGEAVQVEADGKAVSFHADGSAELLAYVGHYGLMDFALHSTPKARDDRHRKAIVLSCMSKRFYAAGLQKTGADPLLWTTNLMAPEAYILTAALDGWMQHESDEQIRLRAATAYDKYQHCGMKSANGLFATGW